MSLCWIACLLTPSASLCPRPLTMGSPPSQAMQLPMIMLFILSFDLQAADSLLSGWPTMPHNSHRRLSDKTRCPLEKAMIYDACY